MHTKWILQVAFHLNFHHNKSYAAYAYGVGGAIFSGSTGLPHLYLEAPQSA